MRPSLGRRCDLNLYSPVWYGWLLLWMYLPAQSERVLHVSSCLNLWLVWAALEFLVGLCEGCYSSEQSGTTWRLEYVLVGRRSN